jgi:hypothetical protein
MVFKEFHKKIAVTEEWIWEDKKETNNAIERFKSKTVEGIHCGSQRSKAL